MYVSYTDSDMNVIMTLLFQFQAMKNKTKTNREFSTS